MQANPHLKAPRRHRARRGFSLLEALLALVIFALISFALSMALSAVFQAQAAAQRRENEANTVRAVFGFLTRDLSAAFISTHNPASVFIANGGQGNASGQSSAGSLLTLTTLAHRIQMDDTAIAGAANTTDSSAAQGMPQADFMLVRYDHDPASGMLYRTISTVPNLEAIGQVTPTPEATLADNVVNLTLRFWDAEQRAFRTEWDYQQQNQAQQDPAQTGAPPNAALNTGSGDATLPAAVAIEMTLRRKDGTTAVFTTTVPVVAPRPASSAAPQATTDPNALLGGAGAGNPLSQGP